ncbi:MAG: potassium channel family protein [Cyanobacteriota bacterium]
MAELPPGSAAAVPLRRERRPRSLLSRWLRLVFPVTRPFSHASQAHKRHQSYFLLLLSCLMVLVGFAMPVHLRGSSTFSYNLVLLVLVFRLGAFSITPDVEHWMLQAYRLLGLATVVSQLVWSFTLLVHRGTGLPLLVLWAVFATWSSVRLVRLLAIERQVNGRVLMGAVAGYLLIGITAGLLLGVLETIHPGSFRAIDAQNGSHLLDGQLQGRANLQVWQLDFERLTYFAFVTITTVGFGDISPVTPQAQMMSVMFAVIGPIYIAVVMGVLISRLTIHSTGPGS